MFDIGFAELLLLSLVGLLVLGPERLPKVARTLGGITRKARSSWVSLKQSIEAEIAAEEIKQPIKQFQDEFKSTVDDVKGGMESLHDFDPLNPDPPKPPKAQEAQEAQEESVATENSDSDSEKTQKDEQ